mmetsp:Transcript_5423/g.9235  ORF Transcript_5423/g.9235 Transcript_5423/m.9235 type:complete len:630 (-) Transcript_5423:1666-3555(-)
MTSTPPTSSSDPRGSSSGWALDVIIVAPAPKSANTGVAASSDFYVSFPSSLAKSRKNSFSNTTKRLSSFVSKKSSSNDVSESGEEDLISERTSSSMSVQTNNSSSAIPTPKGNVQVSINGRCIPKLDMTFSKKNTSSCRFVHGNSLKPSAETLNMIIDGTADIDESLETTCTCSEAVKNSEHHLCAKNNKLSGGDQSKARPILLDSGRRNVITYTLVSEKGDVISYAKAYLYVWSALDSVIVSDIDGTVTKDNVGGVMDTVVQEKYAHVHNGICKFYQELTKISPVEDMDDLNSSGNVEGQVRFMYLSSRPISLVNHTRKLLDKVTQICEAKECHTLPQGPMMCNVVPLTSVLYSELVKKDVHMFKSDVLQRQVALPFIAARGEENLAKTKTAKSARTLRTTQLEEIDEHKNPRSFSDSFQQCPKDDRLFLAGFGNTSRDATAYEMAGMYLDDIYIIDTKSRIMCMGEQSQSQKFEDLNNSDCIPNTDSISDFIVDGVCCFGSGESQVVPGDEPKRGKSQDPSNDSKFSSSRAVFDEPSNDDWGEISRKSNKQSVKVRSSVTQSIRAFSTKKSLTKFSTFTSTSSTRSSKLSHKKVLYQGYDDPRLLEAVRKRIQGDYDYDPSQTSTTV